MAKARLEQIADRDGRKSVLFATGLKTNQILSSDLDFGRVLDNEDTFVLGNEVSKNVE